ncbi:MAG: pseudaminic acid cytidylyltransferase [Succinatimonas hippei]|nr:pseudaminic acid cytidylyltransferase [Succinatimonas hippei]
MRLAVIPARGGSKRIPRKNIRDFNGRPLIAYSITAALESRLFEKVVVSTDDDEIAMIARQYGAQVPFMREARLADDHTGTFDVVRDAYFKLKVAGFEPDTICCIYSTAPMLTADYLKKACASFEDQRADEMYACCEFPFPIQRARYIAPDGTPYPVMPEYMSWRSQDLQKAYQDCGMFYFYSKRFLEEPSSGGLIRRAFEMPRHRVIDIDTPEDWNYAQVLCRAVRELGLD